MTGSGRPLRGGALLLAAGAFFTQGCFSAGYVAQAVRGQFGLLAAARPIREAVTDPRLPAEAARALQHVGAIKEFGIAHGLRPTKNYERYVDLGRPAVVWNVQACKPLAFEVRRWSFPVVGSVPYLGFFDRAAARRYAERIAREEGLDVDVRGVGAYSTLGWFRDPVLSTMLSGGDEALGALANVVLHESVHATLYIPGQSAFDESLATFVSDGLTVRWLTTVFGSQGSETRAWIAAQARRKVTVERLHEVYVELDSLYRSAVDDETKLTAKARILEAVRGELRLVRPINNATLAGYKTYNSGVPAFARLLEACGNSWPRFMKALERLEESDFVRRQQQPFDDVIDRLVIKGCS